MAFLIVLAGLLAGVRKGLRDPEFRGLLLLTGILLACGAAFYRAVEGWSTLDSLYFSLITLTTIGYGDLVPSTAPSKIFTMTYAVLGLGILLGFVNRVTSYVLESQQSLRDRSQGRRR